MSILAGYLAELRTIRDSAAGGAPNKILLAVIFCVDFRRATSYANDGSA
jgi:hypothetical protein